MSTVLRERLISDMQLRRLLARTIKTYVHHVAKFAAFFQKSPEELGLEDIRRYQIHRQERYMHTKAFYPFQQPPFCWSFVSPPPRPRLELLRFA